MVDERRSRILAVAQEVFAEHGFRSADVKTIAERAGVGKATIYKFFASKEALLLTIVEENLNHIRDLALKHLISNEPPLDRCAVCVSALPVTWLAIGSSAGCLFRKQVSLPVIYNASIWH